jgi:SAM-dependent methyltransferase
MAEMRTFHNWVKSELIRLACESVDPSPTLFDFGCGRGGDLKKWINHKVGHVIAVDPDQGSIKEALSRAETLGAPGTFNFQAVPDPLGHMALLPPESVDVVASMFSVHYLDRDQMREFVAQAHRVLTPGGVLLLCFMDAESVLKQMGTDSKLSLEGCSLEMVSSTQLKVHLDGTLYFGGDSWSTETMVFPAFLSRVCERSGMVWIDSLSRPFAEWRRNWKGAPGLDEAQAKVSDLFASGVAVKHHVDPPAQAQAVGHPDASRRTAHEKHPIHKLAYR